MPSQLSIISVHDLNDSQATAEQINDLKDIFENFGSKILSEKTTVLCLNYNECIEMAIYMSENFTEFMENMYLQQICGYGLIADSRILYDANKDELMKPILNSSLVTKFNASIKFISQTENPNSLFTSFVEEFGKIGENALVICDQNFLKNMSNFITSTRKFDALEFSVINLSENQNEPSVNAVKAKINPLDINIENPESFSIKVEECLRKQPLTILHSGILKNQESFINNSRQLEAELKTFQNLLLTNLANNQGGVSYHEVLEIEKHVQKQKEKLENIQKSINHANDMCTTFADQNGPRGENDFLEIKMFHFDISLKSFKMQIENKTDFTFYNVVLLLIDNPYDPSSVKEICTFRIIQNQSKIWKELDIPENNDLYGLHLTLVYRGEHVLREPFYIAPCKLYFKKMNDVKMKDLDSTTPEEEVDGYLLGFYLKNYSNTNFNNVVLSLPETIKEQKFRGLTNFNYGETWVTNFTVKKVFSTSKSEMARNYRVFACDGNKVISNTVIINCLEVEN